MRFISSSRQPSEHAVRLVKRLAQSRIALHAAASHFHSLRDYYVAHAAYSSALNALLDYVGELEAARLSVDPVTGLRERG